MQELYAKSNPQETIAEHTNHVIKAFQELIQLVKLPIEQYYYQYIQKILWYHDSGKANIPFQNRIRSHLKIEPLAKTELEYYPHEWLSPSFITLEDKNYFKSFNNDDKNIDFLKLARYCIAYHHSRNKCPDSDSLKLQLNEIEKNTQLLNIQELHKTTSIDKIKHIIEAPEYWPKYFKYTTIIKGILHKCDYAASAGIPVEIPYKGNYTEHFHQGLKKRKITELHPLQKEVRKLSDKSIIFIASTGSGKTEYSMNWINGDKAFYLLGLRTAVNAMYERFVNMFSDKNVALLHGESIYHLFANENDYEQEDDIFDKHTKIKQLTLPITVATADQLVTSVFKFPGFEFFYVTASYSKVIIDEIQSFSPEAIAGIVVFLQEIQQLGGKFLLMTATLPPFVINEFAGLEDKNELVEQHYYSPQKRHVVELVEDTLFDERAEELILDAVAQKQSVLIIANTVAEAQRLYEQYESCSPNLLHARFIRNDRNKKEEQILLSSNRNTEKPQVWISTQIVEASLDIDFDLLLTEQATIDALFQRFGRCWRKREYQKTNPNIYIFRSANEEITHMIYDRDITKKTWAALIQYSGKLITEEMKQQIITEVFSDIEDTEYFRKYNDYKDLLKLGLRVDSKGEAQQYFRRITNNFNVIPEPVFDEHKEAIEDLVKIINNKKLTALEKLEAKQALFNFTVPVQVFKNKQHLLHRIPIVEFDERKLNIKLLKGVEYNIEKGAQFLKDYKDNDNFIL